MVSKVCDKFVEDCRAFLSIDMTPDCLLEFIYDHINISDNVTTIKDLSSIKTSDNIIQPICRKIFEVPAGLGPLNERVNADLRHYFIVIQRVFAKRGHSTVAFSNACLAHKILSDYDAPIQPALDLLNKSVTPFILSQIKLDIDVVLMQTHTALSFWLDDQTS